MEINRHLNLAATPVSEPAATSRGAQAVGSGAPVGKSVDTRPLEQLQDALRALPEVDMDKVDALRKALRDGTLDSSAGALASGILMHHGIRET